MLATTIELMLMLEQAVESRGQPRSAEESQEGCHSGKSLRGDKAEAGFGTVTKLQRRGKLQDDLDGFLIYILFIWWYVGAKAL